MTVFTLIMCFISLVLCVGRCVYLNMEYDSLRFYCEQYRIRYEKAMELYHNELLNNKYKIQYKQTVTDIELLEAINYARMKAHPDNGGNADRFHRYNELYNKLKRSCE